MANGKTGCILQRRGGCGELPRPTRVSIKSRGVRFEDKVELHHINGVVYLQQNGEIGTRKGGVISVSIGVVGIEGGRGGFMFRSTKVRD